MQTVLVVEDEHIVRFATVAMLEDEGYVALEADNATEAIRILESRTDVRIVVTDVNMPGTMDGLKLAHYVRDRWPPIRLVVVSGRPSPGELPGDAVFLGKPFSKDGLMKHLQSWST